MNLLEALEIRFDSDAGDDLTVREYLRTLLTTLWEEEEGFSGKRPFGNSGWKYELFRPLIAAGLIEEGTLDSEGYVDSVGNGDAYVNDLILAMCHGVHEG